MNDILTQKHKIAEIRTFKNFSNLTDKTQFTNSPSYFLGSNLHSFRFHSRIKNRKTLFFHNYEDDNEYNSLDVLPLDIIKTDDNEIIKKYYNDPFAQLIIRVFERSIKSNADNVTIKIYLHETHRRVNEIYFKKSSVVELIKLNKKTGNFIVVSGGKKRTFRQNSFLHLFGLLTSHRGIFNIGEYLLRTDSIIATNNPMNDAEFLNGLAMVLDFKNLISMSKKNDFKPTLDSESFMLNFIERFVTLKKIKVPNEYVHWIADFYPTEKYLKRNDRKLVASLLDMLGMKSKIGVKILHNHPNIDIMEYVSTCKLFGENYQKYIGNIDFTNFPKYPHTFGDYNVQGLKNSIIKSKLSDNSLPMSDNEKECVVKIINSHLNLKSSQRISRLSSILSDHFDMIQRLKKYRPDLELNSRTIDEFQAEHRELSKQISAMKKGWVIEYQFNPKTIEEIEKPIELKINIGTEESPEYAKNLSGNGLFTIYPKILKREEEYDEEGSFMHHCVASYANKDKSIIVSFRTENSMDRGTCEFDCQTGTLIQARHFCNAEVPADIMLAVDLVTPKIKKLARLGMLHNIEKKKVHIKINGIEVEQEDREPRRPQFGF